MKNYAFLIGFSLALICSYCCGSALAMGEDYKEMPTADKNAEHTLRYLSYAFEARDEAAFYQMMSQELADWFVESGQLALIFSRFKNIELDVYVDERSETEDEIHFKTHWFRSIENSVTEKVQIDEGECTLIFHKTRRAELAQIKGQNPFLYNEDRLASWR